MALSYVIYTANGSTTQFDITFSYIETSHVKVYLDNVATTAFTYVNASRIQLNATPANGVKVKIDRDTPTTARLVDFVSGSILSETDLDKSANQNFYTVQENVDSIGDCLKLDNTGVFDATSKRIINVANPTANQDAVTKYHLENTWLSTTDKTNLTAVAAVTSEMALLGVSAVITDLSILGTADVVSDLNTLGSASVVEDLNILGTADVVNDLNVLGTSGNVTNMNTLSGISSNITTVAGISSNVTTVAGISSNVTAVAGDATDIGAVAAKATEIGRLGTADAVADLAILGTTDLVSDLNTLANSTTVTNMNLLGTSDAIADMNLLGVSGVISDMNDLATSANVTNMATLGASGVVANIATVAGISANVTSVAGISANVTTVATNLAAVNNFGDVYRIASSAPSSSLTAGDLYFNTSTDILSVYGGSGWQNAGSSVNGTSARFKFIATSNQTTFTGNDSAGTSLSYDSGYIDVYLNGVHLDITDYTASNGTSIVLGSGAATGDILYIVGFGTFNVASIASSAIANDLIDSQHYAAGSIDAEHMSANSIDSASYVDGSIDAVHLSANSVDSDAYVDGSIDEVHMSANSVDSDSYVDASIDTAHIGALQVTGAKLNTDVISAQTNLSSEPSDTDEFMVSDNGVLKRIDYSLIKGSSKILQVVQATVTSASTHNSVSTYTASNVLGAITPTAASSKIFISFFWLAALNNTNTQAGGSAKIYRDIDSAGYAALYPSTVGGSQFRLAGATGGLSLRAYQTITYLDSPSYSLTDVITYKLYAGAGPSGYGNYFVCPDGDSAAVILMEVAA